MFFSLSEIKNQFLNLLIMFVLGGFVAALLFSFSPRKEGFETEEEKEIRDNNNTLENFYDGNDGDLEEKYAEENTEEFENYYGGEEDQYGGYYDMPNVV